MSGLPASATAHPPVTDRWARQRGSAERATDARPAAQPLWFLRINPLPRTRLADPLQRRRLDELGDAERAVAEGARLAADELFARIGAEADDTVRRELLALRRAISRDRPTRPEQECAAPAVAAWARARRRRERLRAAVAEGYPAAAERERRTLAGLLGHEDLRCALALAAPELHQEAERYRAAVGAGPGVPVPTRIRKSERGLLQYVTRAMVRTSPLSRFTAVGLAVPAPGGTVPERAGARVALSGAVAFPGVDRVMLGYVLGGLGADALGQEEEGLAAAGGDDGGEPAEESWIAVAPTSAIDAAAGRLYVLRPTDAGLARIAVPISLPLGLVLEAVAMGPRTLAAVAGSLAERSGCSLAHAQRTVRHAVQQGILTCAADPEDGAAELSLLLRRIGSPAENALATVGDGLARLAVGPSAGRAADLARVEEALAAASRLAGRPARVPVTEDYVLPPTAVDPAAWRGRLDDLGATTDLLSVFDWLHDVRALLAATFVERFGRGASVNLAEHARGLVDEVSRRAVAVERVHRCGGSLVGIGPADGSLDRLQALRREVTGAVHARLDAASRDGLPEVVLSAADARRLVERLPERFARDPLLYGAIVQPCGDRLVLGDGLPGHGMLYSRFLAADRALGGDATVRLRDRLLDHYGGDGYRVVEDRGLHGLTVNAHPPVLPDVLDVEQWFALRLEHDVATDTLRVTDRDGRRLRVLPLGGGHPGLFPPPLSVATGLVISGRLYGGLVTSWQAASGWDGTGTAACPRLSVGAVVLSRRRWYGGTELDTVLAAGPAEHDRLLAVSAWRDRHEVPEEVVIKTTSRDEGPQSAGAPGPLAQRLQRKPQYVDLASALSVRVLPRMLERRPRAGYLEEALPAVADGGHATEWVVEIGRRAYGRFGYLGALA